MQGSLAWSEELLETSMSFSDPSLRALGAWGATAGNLPEEFQPLMSDILASWGAVSDGTAGG